MEDVSRLPNCVSQSPMLRQTSLHHPQVFYIQMSQVGPGTGEHRDLLAFRRKNLRQPSAQESARARDQRRHGLFAPHLLEGIQRKVKMVRRMGRRHAQPQTRRSLRNSRKQHRRNKNPVVAKLARK